MERCKECELAVYCFSDSSCWVFRSKREMEEKEDQIANCPLHDQVERARASHQTDSTPPEEGEIANSSVHDQVERERESQTNSTPADESK
ncbi:MAG: hypothetical protein WBW56_18025 [Syntrophobacteraceae bacterium]